VPIPIQVMLEINHSLNQSSYRSMNKILCQYTSFSSKVRVTLFLYLRFFSNLPISTQLPSIFLYFIFWLQKRCSHQNLLKGKGHGSMWLTTNLFQENWGFTIKSWASTYGKHIQFDI